MNDTDDNKSATSSTVLDHTLSVRSMSETNASLDLNNDDRIKLKLIQVSGKTAQFCFDTKTAAADIITYVYDNWPAEWVEENKPNNRGVMQLIFHGRFLKADETLESLKLSSAELTVMHIVSREKLPDSKLEKNSDEKKAADERATDNQSPSATFASTSRCCIVL